MKTEIQALDVKYDHVNEDVIVLKADVKSVKESADRLEQGQEKMSDLLNAHFDALSTSIREIRDVRIKAPLSRKRD